MKHPYTRILPILVAALISNLSAAEPEELTQLRESWNRSLRSGEQAVHEECFAKLRKLQKRLAGAGKSEQELIVVNEIQNLEKLTPGSRSIIGAKDETLIASVRFNRSLFSKKMTDMVKAKSHSYRTKLSSLLDKYNNSGNMEAASAVENAINSLDNGDALAVAGYSLENNEIAKLTAYLAGTDWAVQNTEGKPGFFKFGANHRVEMHEPWYHAKWEVTGPNQILLSHINGHWKYDLRLSDDRKELASYDPNSKEPYWTGQRSVGSQVAPK